MSIGLRVSSTNDRFTGHNWEHALRGGTVGNVTAAPTSTSLLVPRDGVVTFAALACTMGADGANPLSISVQVTNARTGSTIFSTVPSIAKTAGNIWITTLTAHTGVVLPVLQNKAVLAGDVLKAVWTLTRTASPDTEIADAGFTLLIAENEDFDPAVS